MAHCLCRLRYPVSATSFHSSSSCALCSAVVVVHIHDGNGPRGRDAISDGKQTTVCRSDLISGPGSLRACPYLPRLTHLAPFSSILTTRTDRNECTESARQEMVSVDCLPCPSSPRTFKTPAAFHVSPPVPPMLMIIPSHTPLNAFL